MAKVDHFMHNPTQLNLTYTPLAYPFRDSRISDFEDLRNY